MDGSERRRLVVDLDDVATAFENGFPDLSYYLSDHNEERERWFTFRDARLRERIVAWLEDEGIEPLREK